MVLSCELSKARHLLGRQADVMLITKHSPELSA